MGGRETDINIGADFCLFVVVVRGGFPGFLVSFFICLYCCGGVLTSVGLWEAVDICGDVICLCSLHGVHGGAQRGSWI